MCAEAASARAMAGLKSIEAMSVESAILRAYALASQCRYSEAEHELKSKTEALETPHGVDLYARILWAADHRDEARRLWNELSRACPDFEPAKKALSADDNALTFDCQCRDLVSRRHVYVIVGVVAMAIGMAFSVGKLCGSSERTPPDVAPTVIAETSLHGRFGGKELKALKEGIFTNLTSKSALVIRGGNGKYITDRQKRLAVIADCIKEIAGIPLSKMYLQPFAESTDDVVFQIVPAYAEKEAVSE